jgi:hypothetical protein
MSFEKNFCPSPWFHMRINNDGSFEYCRWAATHDLAADQNIKSQHPITWFKQGMKPIRKAMLDGDPVLACSE